MYDSEEELNPTFMICRFGTLSLSPKARLVSFSLIFFEKALILSCNSRATVLANEVPDTNCPVIFCIIINYKLTNQVIFSNFLSFILFSTLSTSIFTAASWSLNELIVLSTMPHELIGIVIILYAYIMVVLMNFLPLFSSSTPNYVFFRM